jgi:voltage-gated potassium channel
MSTRAGRRLLPRRSWVLPAVLAGVVSVACAAGAATALETDTVTSFWQGVWWSISLITTVGFIGSPPKTGAGAVLSVALMVLGFLLLAMVSAALASLFVEQEEKPREERSEQLAEAALETLQRLEARLSDIERALAEAPTPPDPREGSRDASG